MNQPENQEPTNQQVKIEDLPVDAAQQDEVKGGHLGTAGVGILKSTDGGRTW